MFAISDFQTTKNKKREISMKQFVITPAAGKRLIGKAIARHAAVATAIKKGTIVIVAGTTNGFVVEEMLLALGQAKEFKRNRFYRGIILPRPVRQLLQEDSQTRTNFRVTL